MNDTLPPSALRELRAHFANRRTVLALLGVGAMLVLAAPFGTGELLGWPMRVAYWMAIPPLTYGLGFLCHAIALPWLYDLPETASRAAAALLSALAVAALIFFLNAVLFGIWPGATDLVVVLVITGIISFLLTLLPTSATDPDTTPPAILDRIPLDKRGALWALSVEDHYVHIRTERGTEMVLLRLGDAIREVGATPGLQVHRSHWVALDAVASAGRRGDGAVLNLHDGTEIPVSRANVAAVRSAGLLPR